MSLHAEKKTSRGAHGHEVLLYIALKMRIDEEAKCFDQ